MFQNVAILSFYRFIYDIMHGFTTYKFIYCTMLLLIHMVSWTYNTAHQNCAVSPFFRLSYS